MKHATAIFQISILILSLLGLVGLRPAAADSLSPQNTIQVNIEVDEYNPSGTGTGCSLREAIQAANIDTAFGGCTAGSGTDTITFQDSLGVIALSIPIVDDTLNATGDLNIESDLIIQGPGWQALVINAFGNNSRIFEISNAGLDLEVTIQNVGLAYGDSGSYAGGAIFVTESLLLDGVALVHNHSDYIGGAIVSVPDSENSDLTIRNCLFNDNSSEDGGGAIRNASPMIIVNSRILYNKTTDAINGRGGGLYSSGPTTISHTFIYNNRSGAEGGNLYFSTGSNIFLIEDSIIRAGITEYGNGGNVYVTANTIYEPSFTIRRTEISDGYAGDNMAPDQMGGGIFSDIGLTLENVTISGNWASTGGGIYSIEDAWPSVFNNITVAYNSHSTGSYGDGIYKAGTGAIQISNSIVSLNGEAGGCSGRECDCYTGGVYISAGYNLGRGTSCAFENTGDELYDNPSIGPLNYNWGFSRTHELYFDSIAIDTGNNATCPATDQRGWYRPVEGTDLDEPPVATCDKGAYEYGHRLVFLPMIGK